MNTKIILVLCCVIFPFTKSQNAESIIVTLEQGQVRGFLSEDQEIYSFLGIPYASAPTGENRFKAPSPPPSWNGIRDAADIVRCPQISFEGVYSGVEDCLVVNIFKPANVQTDNLPVLVFVHGGAFFIGFGDIISRKNKLLDQNIILVTLNYRLGALGFLCLRTEEVPGNAGLKDQVAALRWVQNNIKHFGGNPAEVTLYGTSAGSVSVELLALSKVTEGLFNKVIVESGSATAGWAISYDPIGDAKTAAEIMGYENVDDVDILANIFRNANAEVIVSATHQYSLSSTVQILFRPCVETKAHDSPFLTDSPTNIINSGNYFPVPMMVAYMNMEGLMFLSQWHSAGWETIFKENITAFFNPDLAFESDAVKDTVAENMKEFYISRTESDLHAFIDFKTDLLFSYKIIESAQLHVANSAPVYLMEFSYHDPSGEFDGAEHADMYMHVFEVQLKGINGELVADRLTTLVGNFVKYANPTPSTSELIPILWPMVTPTEIHFLSFEEELSILQTPISERYQYWSYIYDNYYNELPLPETPDSIDECMEVTLEQGEVRGFLSEDQRRCSFLGIPYASVPTGENRFKAPEPPRSWTDTLIATDTILCPQILNNNYVGVEDCLIINIFTPAGIQTDDILPVLVFIHGGGYFLGYGEIYEGNLLLDQDIIIVTANYRLGAIGFTCLGTEQVPGNAGLKDQATALKWVKNNIANFGGNPNDVTLYGFSAGSWSVELLSLSNATEGLFNKIILESGSAIGSFAVSYDPISAAKVIANIMGHRNAENLLVEELVEIYTSATTYELVSASQQYIENSVQPILLAPCIEIYIDETSVLLDSPMNILQSGNYIAVPTIVAYMDKEGLMFRHNWDIGWSTVYTETFADFLPPILVFETESDRQEVAEEIKQFYLERTEDDLHAFIDFQTDVYFFHSLVTTAQMRATNSAPVYLMEFSYHDHDSSDEISGAGHGELHFHVFETNVRGAGGELAADRITNIFGNFIKYGNPIPSTSELLPVSWPRVTPTAVNYLSFSEDLTARQSPLPERYQFWIDIFDKYSQPSGSFKLTSSIFTAFLSLLPFILL